MSKELKLKSLFEQSVSEGPAVFGNRFEQSLGVHEETYFAEDANGGGQYRTRKVFDPERRDVDHRDFHIGQIFENLCGPRWRNTVDQFALRAGSTRFEGTGSMVLSGDIATVSAGLDVIAGLVNARVLERERYSGWIGPSMVSTTQQLGEGGFDIRTVPNGDPVAYDLAEGQPLPTVTLKPTRIHRNRTLAQGQRIKVNKWTLTNDLTGTLMASVDELSDLVLAEKERKIADCILGIGTAQATDPTKIGIPGYATMMQHDGLQFFPWQAGTYALPGTTTSSTVGNYGTNLVAPENQKAVANFANAVTNDGLGLQDYTLLVRALAILAANRDPFTNLPIPIPLQGMKIFVAPRAVPQVEYILQGMSLWQIANGAGVTTGLSGAGTNTVSGMNLMKQYGIEIVTSQFWANRLTDVGLYKASTYASGAVGNQVFTNLTTDTYNTANSVASFYMLGHFQEAVKYIERLPYQTMAVPLSSQEYAEECVLVQDIRERGNAYWVRPQKAFRAYA